MVPAHWAFSFLIYVEAPSWQWMTAMACWQQRRFAALGLQAMAVCSPLRSAIGLDQIGFVVLPPRVRGFRRKPWRGGKRSSQLAFVSSEIQAASKRSCQELSKFRNPVTDRPLAARLLRREMEHRTSMIGGAKGAIRRMGWGIGYWG